VGGNRARIDFAYVAQYDVATVFVSLKHFRQVGGLLCLFLPLTLDSAQAPPTQPAAAAGSPTVNEPTTRQGAQPTDGDNLVTLFVSAKDKKGQAVNDLTPDEIHLYEDKVEQTIESFVIDSSMAVHLAVLIDVSGSRNDKKNEKVERNAVSDFLHTALHDGDAAAIIVFSDRFSLVTDLTGDQKEFDRALEKIAAYKPHGSTALYDTILAVGRGRIPGRLGRRAIVILSDFGDNASVHRRTDAIQAAQESQTAIYCVVDEMTYESKHEMKLGRQAAAELADQTGGETLIVDAPVSLASVLKQLKSDLHNFYVLRYQPTNSVHNGKIRGLRLETSRKGTTLVATKGYFAPKN
jgi:Ca-activated chloride channel family protein